MSGRRSQRKGSRRERELVNAHRELGLRCERIPLSGGSHYQGCNHDIDLHLFAGEPPLRCESKSRATGFKQIAGWLNGHHVLFLRADHSEVLTVLPWRTWQKLLTKQKI